MSDRPATDPETMAGWQWRAVGTLAGIFSLRMLGLFMVFPVLALFARTLPGASPTLIGLTIGAYGVTQAVLQVPYGLLSDRIGRKRVIVLGLLLFALGSAVAALAHSIWMVVAGRAIQGAGAIAAVVTALVADLTPAVLRTRAMALIGMSVGAAFALSLLLGPLLAGWFGVRALFWITAALALIGVVALVALIPDPGVAPAAQGPRFDLRLLRDPVLAQLNLGIFTLHLVLTATFVAVPLSLKDAGLEPAHHWWVYFPVLLVSVAGMVPMIIKAERSGGKFIYAGAIGLVLLGQVILTVFHSGLTGIAVALVVFFTGFNFLEAHLPARISRAAPQERRGAAMGVYSSCQFLGAFVGGVAGGWMMGRLGPAGTFGMAAVASAIWLCLSLAA